MDVGITAELQGLYDAVVAFANKRVEPLARRIDEEDQIPAQLVAEAQELGLFGLSIPTEYGGLGLGTLGRALVYEALGRSSHGFAGLISAHCGIGTSGLVELGNDEVKRHYLPRMATGEWLACFALTEPQAGSDAAQIRTSAVKKGDAWVLNGHKCFISNAPEAQVFTVFAVTDRGKGAKGISAFVLERQFPGLRVGPPEKKMGLHGSHTAEVFLEDCAVPATNLLGAEGLGYVAALRILTKGRITLAARAVGAMERCIELSVAHARERITMGKPIAEHQIIQQYLADMATDHAAAKALTYQAARLADTGANVQAEASMAKLFATEAFGRVVDLAVQIHGGMGYMKEMAVERFYRDARITRIYEGTSEMQKLTIARKLLG